VAGALPRGWDGWASDARFRSEDDAARHLARGWRRICALRAEHPTWGPKKLKAWLQKQEPRGGWPALSTIGDLLQRRGLVAPKRQRRRRAKHAPRSFQPAVQPNDTWCMDFKGHFALRRGGRCHPLTTQDFVSRYLLIAEALPSEHDALMWPVLERAFVEYGLPRTIRHDNGHPFASPGPGGLSRLSVRLIKLGIVVERTALASPSQNGKLERMHRVMKAEVASPPEATMTAQQRALERFRREYNDERPHEALGLVTPASCYQPSPRTYLGHVPEIEYGTDVTPRRIYSTGVMKWRCSVPRKSRHSCARDSGGASARVGGHAATRRGAASRLARRSLGVCQPSA
jgi:putative transposase